MDEDLEVCQEMVAIIGIFFPFCVWILFLDKNEANIFTTIFIPKKMCKKIILIYEYV